MKLKISNGTSSIVDRSRKSIKVLSHLKKEVNAEDFESIQHEFNRSFDSTGSNIKILNGSFSTLKPIGSRNVAKSSSSHFNPSEISTPKPIESRNAAKSSSTYFNPSDISTPYEDVSVSAPKPIGSRIATKSSSNHFNRNEISTPYEDVSEIEADESTEEEEEALNVTFNYEEDVLEENEASNQYMLQVAGFVQKTRQMVTAKSKKRAELLKKLHKYQKKVKSVQTALKHVDQFITFGNQVPTLIDNLRQDN